MGETRASSISTMPPAKAAGRQREKWKRRAPGAAGSAAAAAQPSVAPPVGGGEEQGQHDAQRIEGPDREGLQDLPRLRRRAVMRGGDGRRQHGGQPRECGGGEQTDPARGHGRPDSSATRWRAPRVARGRQARKSRLKTRIHTAPTKCQYIVAASTAVLRWASKWPSWERIQRKAMNSRPPRTCAPWKPVSR